MYVLSRLLSSLTGCLGHLLGDPVHAASAAALKSTMTAAAMSDPQGSTAHVEELATEIESLSKLGRSITAEEWSNLKALADKHISALSNPQAAPPPPDSAPDSPA